MRGLSNKIRLFAVVSSAFGFSALYFFQPNDPVLIWTIVSMLVLVSIEVREEFILYRAKKKGAK